MKEIIDAVAGMDWGSKSASFLSARFSTAAQTLRMYADALATEAERHGTTLSNVSAHLLGAQVAGWAGTAQVNYGNLLKRHSESSAHISTELNESAALLRQAGHEMASHLEATSMVLNQLGAAFDTALDAFAQGYEKAEEALENLFDSPLAEIQQNIDGYKHSTLLHFAESLT